MLGTETTTTLAAPNVVDDDDIDVLAPPPSSEKYVIAPDAPVLPSMASRCGVELVVKDDGMSMVLFDAPMPEVVHWVEYDMDIDSLTFVTWRGAIFTLGIKIHKPFRRYLSRKNEIYLIQVDEEKKPVMLDLVPLIVRRIGI